MILSSKVAVHFAYELIQGSGLMKKHRTVFARCKASLHLLYLRILRIRATPREIALGFALGVFVGCLPITPFQSIVVIGLAFLCKANKVAGVLGTFITNPLNIIPFYFLFWYIGNHIFPMQTTVKLDFAHLSLHDLLNQGTGFFFQMCLGGLTLGIPLSLCTYFILYALLERYRKRRTKKRLSSTHSTRM